LQHRAIIMKAQHTSDTAKASCCCCRALIWVMWFLHTVSVWTYGIRTFNFF